MDNIVTLPQVLDVGTVQEVSDKVRQITSEQDKIVLDAKDIVKIDMFGLQLLISVIKTSLAHSIQIELTNVGEDLQKYFSYCSLPAQSEFCVCKEAERE